MKVLCFDVGGMSIKYTIIEDEKILFNPLSTPTRVTKDNNYILQDILEIIEKYLDDSIDVIGISTAGVVDNVKGEIVFAGPTIPKYTGTKFKEVIEKKYNKPCFVENDVNSAAYGEYVYNKYKGTVFCMTVGTGVGGAIIIDGKIYTGNSMTAGEIGYMPMKFGEYQDKCSATFMLKEVEKKLGERLNGIEIFERAKNGDKICNEVINQMIDNLTEGMLNIIYVLNPSMIVVGGGITAQGEYLENKIKININKKIISENFKTEVKLAKLENKANLYGMFYIAQKGLK